MRSAPSIGVFVIFRHFVAYDVAVVVDLDF